MVKVNRSIDADRAMSAGKKTSAEKWRSVEVMCAGRSRWRQGKLSVDRRVKARARVLPAHPAGPRGQRFAPARRARRREGTRSSAESALLERVADFGEHRADLGADR